MRFASFFSGGFITAIVVNPSERKLAKRTSVQCSEITVEIGTHLKTAKITMNIFALCSVPHNILDQGKI